MTQTLTTERLREIASSPSFSANPLSHEVKYMARELLANREAQPVIAAWQHKGEPWRIILDRDIEEVRKHSGSWNPLYTAPPAPVVNPEFTGATAVPENPSLAPHVYRDLLDMLQEAAIAYSGTQQLRAQLSSALSIHVQPDHQHTRAAMLAQPVSPGKLPPHAYRELVNSLRDTAVKYSGTDQLRERLNTTLSQFIDPDHPHMQTAEPDSV